MRRNSPKGTSRLKKTRVAVLGFGSQGKAQAHNLRDSGITSLIGLPSKSKSRPIAKKAGFDVLAPEKAIIAADVIVVLLPDHKHKEFFKAIDPKILKGKALIFAHGLSITFGLFKPPGDCDIIMVAPHGPGIRIRERYLAGEKFTAFAGVKQDYSGNAWKIAKAYAAAIGCDTANLFESSFEEEAIGDIFGEQAVLCGGLVGLLETGFESLVKKGHSPESAYLECVYQLDLIIDLVKRYGPAGMFERISKTAAFGSLKAKDSLFTSDFVKRMDKLYNQIKSGKFANSLVRENRNSMAGFKSMLADSASSSLQKTHDKLAKSLSAPSRSGKGPGS